MTDLSDIQTAMQSYNFQEEDMKTKALVMDIDGTLTNSRKEITPATGRAIRTILERGHKVWRVFVVPQWRKRDVLPDREGDLSESAAAGTAA